MQHMKWILRHAILQDGRMKFAYSFGPWYPLGPGSYLLGSFR